MVANPLLAASQPAPRRLAFERAGAVWVAAADGTGFRYVCKAGPGGRTCWSAAWAPDGRSILCQDLESLARISPEGREIWRTGLAQLFPNGGLNGGACISPSQDGRSLLVDVDMDEDTAMKGWDGPPPAIFLVDLDARTSRRLTARGLFAWQPQWLDGSDFLCITMREGDREPSVVRMPLSGGPATVLARSARSPTVSAAP